MDHILRGGPHGYPEERLLARLDDVVGPSDAVALRGVSKCIVDVVDGLSLADDPEGSWASRDPLYGCAARCRVVTDLNGGGAHRDDRAVGGMVGPNDVDGSTQYLDLAGSLQVPGAPLLDSQR
eukprot:7672832-Heterocapsa_arctica.AAC.1